MDILKNSKETSNWETLMAETQQGRKDSYNKLLKELVPYIYRIVQSRAGFLGQTDDIVQESLISIHNARHTYLPGKPLKPWVVTITRRRIIDFLRKAEKSGTILDIETLPELPSVAQDKQPVVAHDGLYAALGSIPQKLREAITLVKLQEMGIHEAAKFLNISESALKARCSRGYKKIRIFMEKRI